MVLADIFCPQCGNLVLDAKECSVCQWRRPDISGEVGRPVWSVALEAKLPRQGTRPVAAGSDLYMATAGGQIVALDTGAVETEQRINWCYQLDSRYSCHGLAVWDKYLLFGYEYNGGFPAPQAELILLSAKNGDELWRYPVDGASLSVPAVRDGIAYFAVNSGWVYAIDLAARQELWRFQLESPWSWAPAAPLLTPTGLLLLPSRSEQLIALDIDQRRVAWNFSAGGWFPHTPLEADGLVYLRCWDHHLYALEAGSGREVWRFEAPRDFNSDLWLGHDYLYVGVKDYREDAAKRARAYALYTIDLQSGQPASRYEVPGHVEGRPVATEGAVFFATDDHSSQVDRQGSLYALDSRGQQLLWQPLVLEQRLCTDLLLVGNLIIVGSREGMVYAVPWQAIAPVEAPQHYLEREEWENAGIAYALQEDYRQAAEIFEQKLEQHGHAGQLYLLAGDYKRVIEMLGQSELEAERSLAVKAAQALPDISERAEALLELEDYLGAAQAYIQIEQYEQAGDGYQSAQAWPEARAAYAHADAWDKWEKLTRELELWDELVERYLEVGNFAQAAEIYRARGLFLEAADNFMKVQRYAEALEAYQQISSEKLTEQDRERIAELAEKTGQPELAIEAYQVVEDLVTAASLAETSGRYNQALALYRELGQPLKMAEMLEQLARYAEAAEIFEREKAESRAAANWEKQVDQKIEQLGGLRYAKRNQQIEAWLQRAIELYEEEEEYAETEEKREYFRVCAERCRLKRTQIRREPLLQVCFLTDQLLVGQGSVVRCIVENVGWGTARNAVLYVESRDLEHQLEAVPLEDLKRDQRVDRQFTVVPTVGGALTLKVKFQGETKDGEPREFQVEGSPYVILKAQADPEATPLPARTAVDETWGSIWNESSPGSSGGIEVEAISADELKRQKIESLRRRMALHHANLNKLMEQAAQYGASMAPVHLLNQIEQEEQAIEDIELELSELES